MPIYSPPSEILGSSLSETLKTSSAAAGHVQIPPDIFPPPSAADARLTRGLATAPRCGPLGPATGPRGPPSPPLARVGASLAAPPAPAAASAATLLVAGADPADRRRRYLPRRRSVALPPSPARPRRHHPKPATAAADRAPARNPSSRQVRRRLRRAPRNPAILVKRARSEI